jgi:hypothetical protein
MEGLKLMKTGWMIKMNFILGLCLLIFARCQCESNPEAKKELKLPEVLKEKLPPNADFYDHIVYDRNTDGSFLSMIVTNGHEAKRLVIENGYFIEIYFDNGKQNGEEYRRTIKPVLKKQTKFMLTNAQWEQVKDHLLELNDTLGQKQYEDTLSYYFPNGKGKANIPKHSLFKLAHAAFLRECFISQNDYSGYYFIKKFKN